MGKKMGEMIELTAADGHTLSAYRAEPETDPRAGIVSSVRNARPWVIPASSYSSSTPRSSRSKSAGAIAA